MAPDSTARHRMHALEALYPYQFAGSHLGLNVSNGWIALFEKRCADVDITLGDHKQGFHWVQCKEKFGKARFYYETANAKRQGGVGPGNTDRGGARWGRN